MRDELNVMKLFLAPSEDVINLATNENQFEHWHTLLAQPMGEYLSTFAFRSYGDSRYASLLAQAAKTYGVSEDYLLPGDGSDQLIPFLMNVLVTQQVAAFMPDFFRYPEAAMIMRLSFMNLSHQNDPLREVERANQAGVEMLLISNPNNPLGLFWQKETLIRICETFSGYVVIDEAYLEFSTQAQSMVDQLDRFPRLLVLKTLSKAWGLASLRLGFVLTQPKLRNWLWIVQGPFTISTLIAELGAMAMHHPEEMQRMVGDVRKARTTMLAGLRSYPYFDVCDSEANFIYVRTPQAKALKAHLASHNIVVALFDQALRITVANPQQQEKLWYAMDQYEPE